MIISIVISFHFKPAGRDVVPWEFLNRLGLCNYPENPFCKAEEYLIEIKNRGLGHCTWWWLSCKFTKEIKSLEPCDKWVHKFNSMVCYEIHCPTTTTAASATLSSWLHRDDGFEKDYDDGFEKDYDDGFEKDYDDGFEKDYDYYNYENDDYEDDI